MAARRAGEITYYEELGVVQEASPEQIRDAFRAMVRILHPDQQTDEQLKDMAERQMRKLNRIYTILSDPERRRQYDDLIDTDYRPLLVRAPIPPETGKFFGRIAWAAAIVGSAGLLMWLASDNTPNLRTIGHDQAGFYPASDSVQPAANTPDQSSELERLRSDLRTIAAERDTAIRELGRLRAALQSASSGASAPPPERVQHAVSLPPAEPQVPIASIPAPSFAAKVASPFVGTSPTLDMPAPNHLAGFWFYARPPASQQNKNRAVYQPEFIEATITQENGVARGTYRSRFQIVDRAISPDVNFSFSGPVNGASLVCPWVGPGGARGELTVKLMPEGTLHIDWTAKELGTQQGLVSGSAVLTRRVEASN